MKLETGKEQSPVSLAEIMLFQIFLLQVLRLYTLCKSILVEIWGFLSS